jgi:hypothetical protein
MRERAYTGGMNDVIEEKLREPEPVAEGRAAPSHEEKAHEEEQREVAANRKIEDAQRNVDMAAMLAPNDPEVQQLKGELMGANANTMDPQKLDRIAREAQDKAAQKTQETIMSGAMTLAGIGAAMAAMGVMTNGTNYPPVLLTTGLLPNNIANLPKRDQSQDQGQMLGN